MCVLPDELRHTPESRFLLPASRLPEGRTHISAQQGYTHDTRRPKVLSRSLGKRASVFLDDFWMETDRVSGCLDVLQECPEDVFLEGVLQPCLERGRLGVLQGLLESLDATLESWGRYLIPACQMLQRKGYYHTLYQLQQFMMVLNTHFR